MEIYLKTRICRDTILLKSGVFMEKEEVLGFDTLQGVADVDEIVDNLTKEEFGDGSHIIYVNGKYKGNDSLGQLISDFHQKRSDKMHYRELASGIKHFKETEEGREIMCESVENYAKAYGDKTAVDIFLGMIKEGIPKETAQRIAKISDDLVEKAIKHQKETV